MTGPYLLGSLLDAYGARPDLVTGIASNTRAGIELVERLTGLPSPNVRDRRALPTLMELLRDRLDLEGKRPPAD